MFSSSPLPCIFILNTFYMSCLMALHSFWGSHLTSCRSIQHMFLHVFSFRRVSPQMSLFSYHLFSGSFLSHRPRAALISISTRLIFVCEPIHLVSACRLDYLIQSNDVHLCVHPFIFLFSWLTIFVFAFLLHFQVQS